jgi:hypothetical protein
MTTKGEAIPKFWGRHNSLNKEKLKAEDMDTKKIRMMIMRLKSKTKIERIKSIRARKRKSQSHLKKISENW